MYKVEFVTSASKEFRQLEERIKNKIIRAIDLLASNPYKNVIKLKGSKRYYRIRSGDYRIVFTINDKDKSILITRIRHRKDVYK